jgi:hypothetical protein
MGLVAKKEKVQISRMFPPKEGISRIRIEDLQHQETMG